MDAGNWVTIIVALIGLIGTITTVALGNKKTEEKSAERQARSDRTRDRQTKEQTELILYRIGELEKKQDKYNHLQERTYKDEQDISVIKTEIRAIKEKIEYLHSD